MDSKQNPAPNQQISKEEVLGAIERICDERGVPVVRSKDIAELDWVDVTNQTINNHLQSLKKDGNVGCLKVGKGYVWWIPSDFTHSGEVDVPSAVKWDSIDPDDIPDEIIQQRPEIQSESYWKEMANSWRKVIWGSLFLVLVGYVVALLDNFPYFSEIELFVIGSVLAVGSIAVAISSGVIAVIFELLDKLEEKNMLDSIRQRRDKYREKFYKGILKRIPSDIPEN